MVPGPSCATIHGGGFWHDAMVWGGASMGGGGRGKGGGGSKWGDLGGTCPLGQVLVNHRLPLPLSNHTITTNRSLTFAASWFGHASHANHGCFLAAFCHIIALHFGPQH